MARPKGQTNRTPSQVVSDLCDHIRRKIALADEKELEEIQRHLEKTLACIEMVRGS